MGATRAEIDRVVALGFEGWIDEQLTTPRLGSHWDWLIGANYAAEFYRQTNWGWDNTCWRQLIAGPDQLRQRMGVALLDFLVVGMEGLGVQWRGLAMGAYADVLLDNALGNYRTLLGAVTGNVAMGSFLTYLGNRKANPKTGAMPDENYARELMQLFTIGLHQLNMDGTPKLGGGQPIETYTSEDVSQLARVMTGMVQAPGVAAPHRLREPLVMDEGLHEAGPSTFLGTTVSGPGATAIAAALDALFHHPNVPPFIAGNLIKRLTTSNPSPHYIERVARVFADNGKGVRGDLAAVARAILLDPEVRGAQALANRAAGRLRDPVHRFTGWARAFQARSNGDRWNIGNTSAPHNKLGHGVGHAPSVFGWFRPGYTPPNTSLSAAKLTAPEFQAVNEQTVLAFMNFMYTAVSSGAGDLSADYSAILAKATDAKALVAEVNLLLTAGQLPPATVSRIEQVVEGIGLAKSDGPINRVGVSIMLTLATPDALVLR
ncbi:hypothetical protein CKY28_17725 [Sphingomonas lenta]|uniref:DUF1800 domain-containing protein n=2 Tax=Sphingomonas lenta TaxID=1141887 RepID=A0A2A2SB04_9SPHN|nr:hypothetical protein CKY28_17725 [Sphingomonas lenta]